MNVKELNEHFQKITNATNGLVEQHIENSKSYFDGLPSFGSAISDFDSSTAIQSLLAHRFVGKFEQPDDTNTDRLKQECFDAWLQYEGTTGKSYNFAERWSSLTGGEKAAYYAAQELARRWVRGFCIDWSRVEITPGETFNSLEGKTSVYQKLASRKSWTVTREAVDDFIKLILSNNGLRTAAKAHLRKLNKADNNALWDCFKKFTNPADRLLAYRMETELLTIVSGSRASSVYKNREKRRFINIEPFGNVLLQRIVGLQLRDLLGHKKLGNNSLLSGQQTHADMIAIPKYATIDLSNASDSNWLPFLEHFLQGTELLRYVKKWRSPAVGFPGPKGKVFIQPMKVSSMGNGFTFEIMTLVLLALARTFDATSRVYGDDIIIKNRVVPSYLKQLELAGFKLNYTKTFINSRFRESCGAFFHDDVGYITSFDIHWCENIMDVFILCNKIKAIKAAHPREGALVFGDLDQLISSMIPSLCMGSGRISQEWCPAERRFVHTFPGYVMGDHDQVVRRKRKKKALNKLFSGVRTHISAMLDDLQLQSTDLDIVISAGAEAHCATALRKERIRRWHKAVKPNFVGPLPRKGITLDRKFIVPRDIFQYMHWLYAGRVSKDTIRFATLIRLELCVIADGWVIWSSDLNALSPELRLLVASAATA